MVRCGTTKAHFQHAATCAAGQPKHPPIAQHSEEGSHMPSARALPARGAPSSPAHPPQHAKPEEAHCELLTELMAYRAKGGSSGL